MRSCSSPGAQKLQRVVSFDGRAAVEEHLHVLDTCLTSIRRFLNRYPRRNMADERYRLLFRLVGESEVLLAGQRRVHLDCVDADLL